MFSKQNAQIPIPYIVLHLFAALNLLILLVAIGPFFSRGPGAWLRLSVIWFSIPPILGVCVRYVIKMIHRWW